MRFHAIQINSAPEALVKQILEQIRTEDLRPGDRLPAQRELAKLFGVGLGTVREALKILGVMGCVTVLPGKGTLVAEDASHLKAEPPSIEHTLSAVSLADLMKAREVVESGAARLASEKADDEDIRRLREITAGMDPGRLDVQAYYETDFGFHIAVAEASQNRVILEIVKLLVDKAHRHIHFMNTALGISSPGTVENCIGSALQVVEFIAAGEAEAAGKAMLAHLNTVNEKLLGALPKSRPDDGILNAGHGGTDRWSGNP